MFFSTLGAVIQTNSGTVCNINWHAQRDCKSITECSECIAIYPQFKSSQRVIFSLILISFLANLSRRLTSCAYSIAIIPHPASSPFHNFKHLLLPNCLANQSQILCGASLGWGNESLFAASGSHDQDGHHAHIW